MEDRERLDALAPERPVRIQHRSGSMWFVNSKGLERLGLEGAISRELERFGVAIDDAGRATGRFFRADEWLRTRWASWLRSASSRPMWLVCRWAA
mgnify:CR=1 FL=1